MSRDLSTESKRDKYNAYQREYQRQWRKDHPESAKIHSEKMKVYLKARRDSMTEEQKEIRRVKHQEWSARNRERIKASKNKHRAKPETKTTERDYYLRTKYGIGVEQYNDLLSLANGRCQCCGEPFGSKGPNVDHCHETGVVRGIICLSCNRAEGLLKTPRRALKLYEYMTKNALFYQGGN